MRETNRLMAHRLLLWSGILTLIWLHSSVAQPSQPSQEMVLKAFGDPLQSCPLPSPLPLQLYIDGSGSMRGFVTDKEATYSKALRQILDRATTAQYPLSIYKFAGAVSSLHTGLSHQLLSPTFYDGDDTSLAHLLTQIAGEATGLSVVVSDLIQSEPGKDQLAMLKAVRKAVEKRPEVLLLAFRSRFCPTSRKKPIEQERQRCSRNQSSYQERAFYVLIIAPCREALVQFQNSVLRDLKEQESFWTTQVPLQVDRIKFAPPLPSQASQSVWNLATMPDFSPALHRFFGAFIERMAPRSQEGTLRFRLAAQSRMQFSSVEQMVYQIEYTTFRGGRASSPVPSALQPKMEREPKKEGDLIVTYPFPRPAPRTWDAYRIRLRAGDGNLSVPPWVQEWSKVDSKSQADTPHLDSLVEAMVRASTEKVVFLEQFILLGRDR